MPVKSRTIQEKITELASRRAQFENELVTASLELERLQSAIVKQTTDTDSVVVAQTKVNVIQQTITAFDLQLAALETDLIAQKSLETKKEIFSKIKVLDDEAEKVGSRFIELYSAIKLLSYIRFVEMAGIIASIEQLKSEFARYIVQLIPDVNQLKRNVLPELENELNDLLAELQKNDCKLSVLRASGLPLRFEYVTDAEHAFRLPENDLKDLIWLSIRTFGEYEQQQNLVGPEKAGMFQRILEKIS
jgi:hypothetical protein